MDFDLRLPIGGLFASYGAILCGYGLFGDQHVYAKSLGYNVNLVWGGGMLLFGLTMLVVAARSRASASGSVSPFELTHQPGVSPADNARCEGVPTRLTADARETELSETPEAAR